MAKINILALSYLFPNIEQPNHGVFVFNRLNALTHYTNVKVINPIPWSPLHRFIPKYKHLANIPYKTKRGNLDIYHPRYFSIPKVFKHIEVYSYERAVKKTIKTSLKGYDFDLVDLHWTYPDLPTGESLSRAFKKPFLVTLRGLEAFHEQDADSRKHIVKYFLQKAHKIIALSEELKHTSIRLGADPKKHTVIRNGVDTALFTYMPIDQARQQLKLAKTEKIIVAVGALIHRKGFDLIINALPELIKKHGENLKLYVIGAQGAEGDYRTSLYALVKKMGVEKNVIFQGAVLNELLPVWYNAADVFCLASRGEGSPNVLTEAISCGCPAVAVDVGAVKEIMESEPNIGECVISNNSEALGLALDTVLTGVQAGRYQREQNAQVFSQYHWDWCAKKVLDVYNAALKSPLE